MYKGCLISTMYFHDIYGVLHGTLNYILGFVNTPWRCMESEGNVPWTLNLNITLASCSGQFTARHPLHRRLGGTQLVSICLCCSLTTSEPTNFQISMNLHMYITPLMVTPLSWKIQGLIKVWCNDVTTRGCVEIGKLPASKVWCQPLHMHKWSSHQLASSVAL
jgi:hypothetical protein